jgi:branched-subunit amino acid ABC-type transport system permease component
MTELLPFVITGLVTGSVYALASLGLVLTYKTSGLFNFAHGAVASAVAYAFYELHVQRGLPWPAAVAICLLVVCPLAGLVLERLARNLAGAPLTMRIVATVGLLLAVRGLVTIRYGSEARNLAPFLPTGTIRIGGVTVGWDQLIIVAIALVSSLALFGFFKVSRTGLAMRAVVDDADLLGLNGVSPTRVRRAAWCIGAAFAGLSGILFAPLVGLDPTLLTLLVVQAFGAAALGAFQSLGLTYAGGLGLGVAAALGTKYFASTPSLANLPVSLPFLVLFAVLVFGPASRLRTAAVERQRKLERHSELPARARLTLGAGGAVALLAVPFVTGARLPVYTSGLVHVILFLSLGLLVRTSGQVALCHAAFAAVGASTFSHLAVGAGLPWAVAVALAALATVPLGAVVAIPAIRLSGLYLALATFGFGILVQRMGFTSGFMFGQTGVRIAPRPSWAETDRAYYFLVLAAVVLVALLVVSVTGGRLGRLLRGLSDSPTALSTLGTNVDFTRVVVFCLSAFLAGLAGALLGPLFGNLNGVAFESFNSLIYLAVLAIAGGGTVRYGFVAAALFIVGPSYISSAQLTEWIPVAFGSAAVIAAVAATAGNPLTRLSGVRLAGRTGRSPVAARREGSRTATALAAEGAA